MAKPPPRLFVGEPLDGRSVPISREQAHYLGTVLRLDEGADVLLFNGRDGEWQGRIGGLSRKGGHVDLSARTREQAEGPELTLLFAPLKKGPTDLVVRMGTELGIRRFVPVLTDRTQADRVKIDRLAAIATEAAEQCERLDVPAVEAPSKLAAVLNGPGPVMFCDEAEGDPTQRWGGEGGHGRPVAEALNGATGQGWSILIGPEGGFSPDERDALRARPGTIPVSLGPRILKAETAAVAAITLWQSALGDHGRR